MILFLLALALHPLTIEDYATMPSMGGPRFSPDGQRIAYVVTRADMSRSAYDSDVWIVDASGRNNFQLTRGRGSDSQPRWSPDGKRLAFLSDRDGTTAIYLIDPGGGEATRLTEEKTAVRSFDWSPDGASIAFLRSDERTADDERRAADKDDARVVGAPRQQVHLYIIEVESRAVRRITSGRFSVLSFSWSPDGRQFALESAPSLGFDDYYRTDIFLVDAGGGEPRPLVARRGADRRPLFSPDGKSIAFVSAGDVTDWLHEQRLNILALADGRVREVAQEYDGTPDDIAWSRDSRSIWFDGTLRTTTQIFRVNADGTGFRNVSNFAGLMVDVDVDSAHNRVVFVQQSLTAPPEIGISDTTTFSPRLLTSHNSAYRNVALGETRVIRWKNPQDGLEIEGLLTLPIGYVPGRKYPLLTFVHGGPASHFDQGFIGYLGYLYPAHVFAAHGFVMLRPNPRGTGGYGERFMQANRNDWGGMDWADVNAGIDALIEQGIADPDRLGLMGWSYGGFLASWSLGHSDRFKAVSIGAPVVDLLSFHGTTDIRDFVPSFFPRMPLELLRERSPIWHLKPTRAVVLIQHGENDERVPISQGTMLYRVLNELGVDVTMVTYPRSPHTPREPKLRLDVARRNVELFTRVLK